MSINKFTNDLDDASLHSNGFADAAKPNSIGASFSPQSFNQRQHVERTRRSVDGYHRSMIANGHHRSLHYQRPVSTPDLARPEPDTSTPRPASDSRYGRRTGALISDVVKPTMRPNFHEPPARGYNPYK